MRKYRSGYIAWKREVAKALLIKGKFFIVNFSEADKDKSSSDGYEAIIHAKNYQNARLTTQLIASALSLIDGCAFFELRSLLNLVPMQEEENDIPIDPIGPISVSRSNIVTAIKIAAKSTYRKKYYLSLLKYQIGCELHSNEMMDLYPDYYKLSRNPADHLRLSHAVVIYYSVLEELGFEIRASYKNPSKINGKWNPKVKMDLEKRLLKSKIDINKEIDWKLRSTPTKIEKLSNLDIGKKSDWSGANIRDSKIKLIDAIAQAS
jgi:hypothetical protein